MAPQAEGASDERAAPDRRASIQRPSRTTCHAMSSRTDTEMTSGRPTMANQIPADVAR